MEFIKVLFHEMFVQNCYPWHTLKERMLKLQGRVMTQRMMISCFCYTIFFQAKWIHLIYSIRFAILWSRLNRWRSIQISPAKWDINYFILNSSQICLSHDWNLRLNLNSHALPNHPSVTAFLSDPVLITHWFYTLTS